jgi:LPXTG-motif cell wall-anchored protein
LTLGASTFTNQELTQIAVTKKFDDNNDQDGSYTILYEGLAPLDETGAAYQYSVKEVNTHGYTAIYATADQQAAYDLKTITNQHTPITSNDTRKTTPSSRAATPNTGDQTNTVPTAGILAFSTLLAGIVLLLKRKYSIDA